MFILRIALIVLLAAAPVRAFAAEEVRGPADVALLDQAMLKLPKGYVFLPKARATAVMNALGNGVDETFIGAVVSADPTELWFVGIQFDDPGYIRDTAGIDADALLSQIAAGMESDNAKRRAQGLVTFEAAGWTVPPHYDPKAHQFVWALEAKAVPPQGVNAVNFNTYALGRAGYISLNLATTSNHIEKDKAVVEKLLSALSFNPGKRYEDFDPKTDKVAKYGLLQLVSGMLPARGGARLVQIGVLLLALLATAVLFKWRKA